MKKIYSIISHTHWDREWYLTFEQFRLRLVDMMDHLLEILEKDREYRFHLDAQTVVLEDYLEIRPHKKDLLKKYVSEGRLLVGPWYVQNDFHLTSGEATVRNLIIGKRIASEYGDKYNVGYAADQFGICSQLPQILNGFDIDSCVFGRGYKSGERQFYWESEDGSRILCEHMANWYNNLQRLPSDPKSALELTRNRANTCFQNAKGSSALLMNGVDHLEAQEDLTDIIDGMRAIANDDEEIIQDILPDYIERLKKEIDDLGLQLVTYTGEMREGGQGTVLTGTLSSRIHLKQQNVATQTALEGVFEPQYATLDALGVVDYPRDHAEYLWKTLIQNHPHDSICGCSLDAVHRHMEDRSLRLKEAIGDMNTRADESYMQHLDRTRKPENAVFITCINNSVYPYVGDMRASIDMIADEDSGAFKLTDEKGNDIAFEVVSITKGIGKRVLSPINLPGVKKVNRYVIAFRIKMDGMARKTLVCTPCEGEAVTVKNRIKPTRILENRYLKVYINDNGTVNITDKVSGATFENALLIEDNSDNSDNALYCYKLGNGDEIVTSENVKAKIKTVKDTFLERSRSVDYTLDVERNGEKYKLPVNMVLTLKRDSRRLDVSVTLDNTYNDHRVRVYFPTGINADKNYASQPFDVIERNKISRFADDDMHPNSSFVGVEDGTRGVALLNKALYEYEHIPDENGTLALTLLRCAGKIGTYMADAETPEGQCIGKYTLEFAVYPYTGDRISSGVAVEADRFINPPYTAVQHNDYNKFVGGRPFVQAAGVPDIFYRPLERPEIKLPFEFSPFTIMQDKANALMLSAFKGAEDGSGQIIRLYNTTSQSVKFAIKLGYKANAAYVCNLEENEIEKKLISRAGIISLSADPKQIITVKVVKK